LIFWGVFHEAGMAEAFKYMFMDQFYGHLTAIILISMTNYLRSKEEEEHTQINNSIMLSSTLCPGGWATLGKTDSSEVIDPIHGSLILSLAASDRHSYDLGSLFPH
jgi:hypothetical protein|tara:strand:+ start:4139 stop:4456 length:318 start_codon:yes stop_codon:yes gene_type:complete